MPLRVPFCQVTLEGEDVTPWLGSLSVTEDDRQADSVSLTFPDPRMIYADALFEGSTAEVDLGYAETGQHTLMIRAIITKVELSYPQDGIPTLTLKGEDRSILMGLEERHRRWRDRTVTDIVREVAQPYGYSRVEAQLSPDPRIGSRPLLQDGKTDLAFLQELAGTYHAKCFVELDDNGEEILYFIPERRIVQLRRPDRLLLRYRVGPHSNLISFSPSFDSSYLDRLREVNDVDTQGQPVRSQEEPPAEVEVWQLDPVRLALASDEDHDRIMTLYEAGAGRRADLQQRLAARRPAVGEVVADQDDLESTNDSLESRRLGMSARGSTFGNIWLRAKSRVTVEGTSQRFDGEWYVSSVTHRLDSSGFKSEFQAVR
jgi:phage protein D